MSIDNLLHKLQTDFVDYKERAYANLGEPQGMIVRQFVEHVRTNNDSFDQIIDTTGKDPYKYMEYAKLAIFPKIADTMLQAEGYTIFRYSGSDVYKDVFSAASETVVYLCKAAIKDIPDHEL